MTLRFASKNGRAQLVVGPNNNLVDLAEVSGGLFDSDPIKAYPRWEELRAFAAKAGTPGLMPRWRELKKAGRADVVAAVRNRGGFAAVAKRTGLNVRSSVTLTLPQTVAGLRNYLMETTALGASPRLDMPPDSELRVRASPASAWP
jgi:hypothetical protein